MIVKLTGLIDPERKIHAIKAYRALTGLGLKDSKQAVDGLGGYSYGYSDVSEGSVRRETPIVPVVIEIDHSQERDIAEAFFYEVIPTSADQGIDRALVLDLMFVALANCGEQAYALLNDPAFIAIKDAL